MRNGAPPQLNLREYDRIAFSLENRPTLLANISLADAIAQIQQNRVQ